MSPISGPLGTLEDCDTLIKLLLLLLLLFKLAEHIFVIILSSDSFLFIFSSTAFKPYHKTLIFLYRRYACRYIIAYLYFLLLIISRLPRFSRQNDTVSRAHSSVTSAIGKTPTPSCTCTNGCKWPCFILCCQVFAIAAHLVYWGMATIVFPLCESNVYVVAPNSSTSM